MHYLNSTYSCLCTQLGYKGQKLTYTQWKHKPRNQQCAYLFVTFFSSVKSAWHKAAFSYVSEEQAVEVALQYLEKNVDKILKDKKRYSAAYIHTVCYNCMRDLRWIQRDMKRARLETPSCIVHDGEELDIFEVLPSDKYLGPEKPHSSVFQVAADMGLDYENVAYHLMSPKISVKKSRSNSENAQKNPFSQVNISSKVEVMRMKSQLRKAIRVYVLENRPDLVKYVVQ